MKKQILTFISVFTVLYLMWSFVLLTFDFTEWEMIDRVFYVFISSVICLTKKR